MNQLTKGVEQSANCTVIQGSSQHSPKWLMSQRIRYCEYFLCIDKFSMCTGEAVACKKSSQGSSNLKALLWQWLAALVWPSWHADQPFQDLVWPAPAWLHSPQPSSELPACAQQDCLTAHSVWPTYLMPEGNVSTLGHQQFAGQQDLAGQSQHFLAGTLLWCGHSLRLVHMRCGSCIRAGIRYVHTADMQRCTWQAALEKQDSPCTHVAHPKARKYCICVLKLQQTSQTCHCECTTSDGKFRSFSSFELRAIDTLISNAKAGMKSFSLITST